MLCGLSSNLNVQPSPKNPDPGAICGLAESICPELAIGAFDGERLLGLAGFHYEGRSFTSGGSARGVISRLGWIKGLRALALFSILERKPQAGELLMDGIVVDPDIRGHGIGTGLLQAVCEYARERGLRAVRLDVVDTNPGAQRLYERRGFVPLRTERHPICGSWVSPPRRPRSRRSAPHTPPAGRDTSVITQRHTQPART